jgi:hypothetical protein
MAIRIASGGKDLGTRGQCARTNVPLMVVIDVIPVSDRAIAETADRLKRKEK